ILIYAYSQGIFSSRQIEKKCKKDLSFMYISHLNCPNFRVLSDFRKENWEFFIQVFSQSVKIAAKLGMVPLAHVSVDGSKFFADTSKSKAASYGRLKKAEAKLEEDINKLLKKAEDKVYHNGTGYSIPEELKRKKGRLSKIKKAKKALEKREGRKNTEKIKESSQISYADTQARIMKIGRDFDYCCNGQISVDSANQIIVGQHLSSNPNDKRELLEALKGIKDATGKLPDKISADSGYLSSDNIDALKAAGVMGYIATVKGEDTLSLKKDKIGKTHFRYQEKTDQFICPAGHKLELKREGVKRTYVAEGNHCTSCPLSKKCSANKKEIPTIITDSKGLAISAMAQKMATSTAKEIYRKRKTIVEPVYGQIKTGGFTRFRVRGLAKASGEFALISCGIKLKEDY
ncbi:MAG: IS1182 family transposase, partial [Actinomycetota bacterium]